MTKIKYKTPKVILEVRAIKRKLSKEIERLGWEGFHEKCQKDCGELMARIENARQAKLAMKR